MKNKLAGTFSACGMIRNKEKEEKSMKISETKESKEKRKELIKNYLIGFGEDCENMGGIKKMLPEAIELWARKIIREVEKN